ncbi:MAG: class I SAM-dependent methyltransferase [Bacteroidota bacterium]
MLISKRLSILVSVLCITFSNYSCAQKQNTSSDSDYIIKKGSYDGIGKWYMGREISHVMGFQGISWLERSEREKEENTSVLIKNMKIKKTDVIADIGAGSGYHVFKMAPLAENGLVYAVDIQDEMLTAIEQKKRYLNITNVTAVKGSLKSVNLPKNSVDKILMVDVYHEFSFPKEMLSSIKSALKANGEIYLIEYRGEDPTVPIKKLHKMTEKQAVKEMAENGFKLKQNIDNLPWQHCMVFIKDK